MTTVRYISGINLLCTSTNSDEFVNRKTNNTASLTDYYYSLFSRTTWLSQYQKRKTSLDLNEARDDGVLGCSGISWTIHKQSAPHSRQITTPTSHQSMFTGWMLFLMPNQQRQCTEGNMWRPASLWVIRRETVNAEMHN